MAPINLQKTENKYAVITAIYQGTRYSSIPLELLPNSDNIKLVLTLSEAGTSSSNMIKFPIGPSSFMIFSKEQLMETLFEVNVMDNLPKVKKEKTKQVNS